jgi:hypothetical protein
MLRRGYGGNFLFEQILEACVEGCQKWVAIDIPRIRRIDKNIPDDPPRASGHKDNPIGEEQRFIEGVRDKDDRRPGCLPY